MQAQQAILTQLILYHCNKEIKHAYLDSLEETGGILLEKVRKAQQKNCPLVVYGALLKKKKTVLNNWYLYLLVNSYFIPLTSKNKTSRHFMASDFKIKFNSVRL